MIAVIVIHSVLYVGSICWTGIYRICRPRPPDHPGPQNTKPGHISLPYCCLFCFIPLTLTVPRCALFFAPYLSPVRPGGQCLLSIMSASNSKPGRPGSHPPWGVTKPCGFRASCTPLVSSKWLSMSENWLDYNSEHSIIEPAAFLLWFIRVFPFFSE